MFKNNKGFTLVELLVTVTVLGILATIGFVSYRVHTSITRDATRTNDVKNFRNSLELNKSKYGNYVVPNESVQILENGQPIAYQGLLGKKNLSQLDFTNGGIDPLDMEYYNYMTDIKGKKYQIVSFLESNTSIAVNSSSSLLKDERYPYVVGNDLGMLFDQNNFTSINELGSDVDVVGTSGNYIGLINNELSVTGTGENIKVLAGIIKYGIFDSCNTILRKNKSIKGKDGVYSFVIDNELISIYCDMTTDGGGWTYVSINAGGRKLDNSRVRNFFDTGVDGYVDNINTNISSKGNLSDIWLDQRNKDIMLHCFTNSLDHKPYEEPFIIYDYEKSDISNLTNDVKVGQQFSSKTLEGKWNGKKIFIHPDYGTSSSQPESMYLYNILDDGSRGDRLYHAAGGNKIYMDKDNAVISPSYILALDDVRQDLDIENYCLVAIR